MILSTGWRTDIPAFYSEWFFNRMKDGYLLQKSSTGSHYDMIPINPDVVDVITFCSKDYSKFIDKIHALDNYRCYYYYSITPYESDLETYVPSIDDSIDTFKKLSNIVGKDKICWRFDPILLNDKYTEEHIIEKFEHICNELSSYTEKCIFSFVHEYAKTKRNCPGIKKLSDDDKIRIINKMLSISKRHHIALQTCGHGMSWIDRCPGLMKSACVDSETFEKVFSIKFKNDIAKGNLRTGCGCMEQVNIGEYHTCLHDCKYCYATNNLQSAETNFRHHHPDSNTFIGYCNNESVIKHKKYVSLLEDTNNLFR